MTSTEGTAVVLVLSTWPADRSADALAQTLVEERLAACVSVLPSMRSTYRWQGVIEHADERQVMIKTTADRVAALKRRLVELHPYDVPEILVVAVNDGGTAYLDWVTRSVLPGSPEAP